MSTDQSGYLCSSFQGVCTDGDIRLVGGVNEFRGRVETCDNGQWGTVCDDGWTDNDAVVVCSQAGHAFNGGIFFYLQSKITIC